MAMNRIQFQPRLSMPNSSRGHGTEAQCEQACEAARWQKGCWGPRCGHAVHYVLRGGARKISRCAACCHQVSLIARPIFQGTKLPLSIWFVPIYLINQVKIGLSALALKVELSVNYPIGCLTHPKVMLAMAARNDRHVLGGKGQVDDAYPCGERNDGCNSENKGPFIAVVSMDENNRPLRARLTYVPGFTLKAIFLWANAHLAPFSVVFTDILAAFAHSPMRTIATGRPSWPDATRVRPPSSNGSIPSSTISKPVYALPGRHSTSLSTQHVTRSHAAIASTPFQPINATSVRLDRSHWHFTSTLVVDSAA